MTTIGIVGAGIAGLHLALHLQRNGISVTLYTDRTPDEMRAARLPATSGFTGVSRLRDAALGVDHWDEPENHTAQARFRIASDLPLGFTSKVPLPGLYIDMRLYLPRAMEDFAARGGEIVIAPCRPEDVGRLAGRHALVIVATGRGGLSEMFPRMPEWSPYDAPQRRLLGGLFRGIQLPRPFEFGFNIVPGAGEIFELQMITRHGPTPALLVEAIPGGPLEPLTHLRYEDDPAAFSRALLAALREHVPDTYARIDPAEFAPTGPLDVLTGAVVPTARRAFIPLDDGRFAMALGDAHVAFDPITGQGANTASRSAWRMGELVTEHARAGKPFDEAFCKQAEEQLWSAARAACAWTNAALQPPPPHVIGLFFAASQSQAIADAFTNNFLYPDRQWEVLRSPEATEAFLAGATALAA
ncbi:putative monooxygenase [Minicystis rosea]|nr:putative monooxygenase [Minicystis rosea]